MQTFSIILVAIASFFLLSWAFVAWLKVREHHDILHDENLPHKSHVTWMGRPRSRKNQHTE